MTRHELVETDAGTTPPTARRPSAASSCCRSRRRSTSAIVGGKARPGAADRARRAGADGVVLTCAAFDLVSRPAWRDCDRAIDSGSLAVGDGDRPRPRCSRGRRDPRARAGRAAAAGSTKRRRSGHSLMRPAPARRAQLRGRRRRRRAPRLPASSTRSSTSTRDGSRDAVRACWASYWSARALFYRHARGVATAGMARGHPAAGRRRGRRRAVHAEPRLRHRRCAMVVEYCTGLADRLVAGEVDPGRLYCRAIVARGHRDAPLPEQPTRGAC